MEMSGKLNLFQQKLQLKLFLSYEKICLLHIIIFTFLCIATLFTQDLKYNLESIQHIYIVYSMETPLCVPAYNLC